MILEAFCVLKGVAAVTALTEGVVLPAIHRKVGAEKLKEYEKHGDPVTLLRGRSSEVQEYVNHRINSCDATSQAERDAAYAKADALFDKFAAQAKTWVAASGK